MSDKMNFFGKIMTLHILSCSTNAFLHCTTAGIPLKPAYSRKTSCKQLALTRVYILVLCHWIWWHKNSRTLNIWR